MRELAAVVCALVIGCSSSSELRTRTVVVEPDAGTLGTGGTAGKTTDGAVGFSGTSGSAGQLGTGGSAGIGGTGSEPDAAGGVAGDGGTGGEQDAGVVDVQPPETREQMCASIPASVPPNHVYDCHAVCGPATGNCAECLTWNTLASPFVFVMDSRCAMRLPSPQQKCVRVMTSGEATFSNLSGGPIKGTCIVRVAGGFFDVRVTQPGWVMYEVADKPFPDTECPLAC